MTGRGGERDAWWVGATKAPSNKRVKAAGEPELPRALCRQGHHAWPRRLLGVVADR